MQIKNAVYIKIGCKGTISNSQKLGVDSKKCKKNDICKEKAARSKMSAKCTTAGMQCRINGRNTP